MGSRGVFEGVKVADFSWVGVGPITIKYLADHGATVVHAESSTRPDGLRMGRPFKDDIPGIDRSQFFANFNSSKYSLALNLSKPKGVEVAKRLVMWADVVAESYTPKAMKNWGLDYESLRKMKPDIIMVSTCQMGQTGPYTLFAGYGNTGASLAGLYELTGWPDQDPLPVYGAYTDFISPRFLAATIMAALDYRRRTGKGQYIDQSQIEAGVQFSALSILDYTVNHRVMSRTGNRSPHHAPHGAYPCLGEDRWVAIAVGKDAEWEGLCRAMGNPSWSQDPRFSTFLGRKEHEEELDQLLGGWTSQYPPEEVQERLQKAGVPAGVVARTQDLFEDPQLKDRGHFRRLLHTEMGEVAYDGPSFRLSKTPDGQFAAPCLGEHNEHVLKEFLGMNDDEISDLIINEVLV